MLQLSFHIHFLAYNCAAFQKVNKVVCVTRYSYSYNGGPTESHIRSIEPRHILITLNDPKPRFQGQGIL